MLMFLIDIPIVSLRFLCFFVKDFRISGSKFHHKNTVRFKHNSCNFFVQNSNSQNYLIFHSFSKVDFSFIGSISKFIHEIGPSNKQKHVFCRTHNFLIELRENTVRLIAVIPLNSRKLSPFPWLRNRKLYPIPLYFWLELQSDREIRLFESTNY